MRVPFNINFCSRIKYGHFSVVTKSGKSVRIVCFDAPNKRPICGFVSGESDPYFWSREGIALCDEYNLFVLMDDPIFQKGDIIRYKGTKKELYISEVDMCNCQYELNENSDFYGYLDFYQQRNYEKVNKSLTPYQEELKNLLMIPLSISTIQSEKEREELAELYVKTYGDILLDYARSEICKEKK